MLYHRLSYVKIRYNAVLHRAHRYDILRRSAYHLIRLFAYRNNLTGVTVYRNHRRLAYNDALTFNINDSIPWAYL